jgi:mRNA interferase RelE/StbE
VAWTIRWERRAIKDMAAFSAVDRERIARFLRDRVAQRENPRELGEALAGPFAGKWKYRIGDFRVVAVIEDATVTILIARVGNRRAVYRRVD